MGTAPAPPRRPTLIFDGDCGFCRRWVRRLRRLDRADAIEYLPLQSPSAVEVSACSRDRLRQAVHFVGADGAVHAGASAVREAFRYLQGGRIVRSVLGVPWMMRLAERIYAGVARRWGPVPTHASSPGFTPHDRPPFDANFGGRPMTTNGEPQPTAAPDEAAVQLALRKVKDPEAGLNIVDLGLVYDVEIVDGRVSIKMTLTSPACPAGPQIMTDVDTAVRALGGVRDVRVELVWEPYWTPERIDPKVRAYLGF